MRAKGADFQRFRNLRDRTHFGTGPVSRVADGECVDAAAGPCALESGFYISHRRVDTDPVANRLPYAKVFHSGDSPLVELARVGAFAKTLPSVEGRPFPLTDEELLAKAGVPDPKWARHLARSGCLLLLHFRALQEVVRSSGVGPARVGIYAVVSQASADWAALASVASATPSQLSAALRKELPRKQLFKTSAYSGITQLGILLGLHGPQLTFYDEEGEFPFLIDQARFDLESRDVDLGIVMGANALDDPFELVSGEGPPQREVSACLAVTRDHLPLLVKRELIREPANGAAGGLVAFLDWLGHA